MEDSCKTEFGKRFENFNQSPEMKIFHNLQALKSSFRVFEGNFYELMQFLKHLEDSRESLTKYASDQKENLELLIEETSRLLHNFLASAQSLVEHMKIIVDDNNKKKNSNSKEFKKEYQIKLDQDIKNNPLYIFVKKLRNHTLHQALPVLALSMIFADDLRFSMRIDIKTFKQWDSWPGAKNDLETIEDTLCIADLVNKYFMLICDFYTWLTERQQNIYQPDIEKLQKMQKEMDEEFMIPEHKLQESKRNDKQEAEYKCKLENVSVVHTLSGHSKGIFSLAISPDGQTLVSGSSDKTIKIWQLSTGRELRTLTEHSHLVNSLAISPDGQTFVSGSSDKTIKIWQLSTWQELRTLTGHSYSVSSLAISPDGQTLVSGSRDEIKIWQLSTGRELRTLTGHFSSVDSLAISPDGQTLVSGSWDNTIKIWCLSTGQELLTLTEHSAGVFSLVISPDGQTLVSGSCDHMIKIWELSTGRELRTLTGHSSWVYSLAICPYGQILVSGSQDEIKIWELSTGRELRTLTGHSSCVYSLAISPDGQMLLSGSGDTTIKIWRVV